MWLRATISSTHKMRGQARTSMTTAPTGIKGYLTHHCDHSLNSSGGSIVTAMATEIAMVIMVRASIESESCQTKKNLCQLGLRVRHPKKKNSYTPKPCGWSPAQLVQALTLFST